MRYDDIVVSAKAITESLCRQFEGLSLTPYLCPAGIPTIGFGSTRYENGTAVTLTDPAITEEYAENLLGLKLDTIYLPAARRLCPQCGNDPKLWAAVADFCYNLGPTAFAASTLRRKLNASDWIAARREIARWCHSGGRRLAGLTRRRAAEASLLPG